MTPFEVKYRRRNQRGKRWAIIAAFAAAFYLGIAAALMLISPDAPASPELAAVADAPVGPVEPQAAAPAAALTVPVAAPSLQDAGAARPARLSPAVGRGANGSDARLARGASATPVNAADIKTTEARGYVVQVAAVPDLQEAQAVLDTLVKAGHPAYLTAKSVDGVRFYRVRLGPFTLRPAAEELASRLEREGHRAPWVTQ